MREPGPGLRIGPRNAGQAARPVPTLADVSLSRWSWQFLPVWTFFLGMLVGGSPGGLTRVSNYPPLLLYVALTGAVWVPAELYARRRDRERAEAGRVARSVDVDTDTGARGRDAL